METSKTVDQALLILITLGDKGPMSPTELARELGMNRTVVHRLLATLHARGFLRRQGEAYAPGAVLIQIASTVEALLRSVAEPVLARLSEATSETVLLSIVDGDMAVWLHQETLGNSAPLRVIHSVGSRRGLELTAGGRALLAHLPSTASEPIVAQSTSPRQLQDELSQIRDRGYATSYDEMGQGLYAIAAPVRTNSGNLVAAISITTPAVRTPSLERFVDPLLKAAMEIAESLEPRDANSPR